MKRLLLTCLAVLLILEEWLWEKLTALGDRLSVWLHLRQFEQWLAMASPEIAMAAFLLPILLILPIKLGALLLVSNGQILQGIVLLILAKLFMTLLISRMFAITRAQLLTFRWFSVVYVSITRWLGWAHERIRATEAYRQVINLKHLASARLAEWLRAG